MQVHLIKSPEYSSENYSQVVALLQSNKGPIRFCGHQYSFDLHALGIHQVGAVSWVNLFSICNYFRQNMQINENDFVILLTDRRNELNWFSAPDPNNNKNIFIHTEDWSNFTNLDRKYPIAFQVAENLFQVLMGVDFIEIPNKYAHNPLVGCINDICFDKFEVVAKLKSAAICGVCLDRILETFSNFEIAKQLKKILNLVRDAYDIDFFDLVSIPLSPITFKEKNRGTGIEMVFNTYNQIIKLDPQELAIYLFFIRHAGEKGFTLEQIKKQENIKLIADLYHQIAQIDDVDQAYNIIAASISNTFSQKTSRIKSKMKSAIVDLRIYEKYIILRNSKGYYNIQIPRELVTIQF